MRSRRWSRTVGEAFPATSEMAQIVWGLLVVRADLLLEMRHIGADDEKVKALDPVELFARFYFFRGSMISLASGCILLNRLRGDPEFQVALDLAPELAQEFINRKRQVDIAQEEFTHVRNAAAGHAEKSVPESLSRVPAEHRLTLEFSEELGLGSELACVALMATAFPDVKPEDQEGATLDFLGRMAAATEALFRAIEIALQLYDKRYPLYPR